MERGNPVIEEHEGEKFLRLLGLDHLADTQVVVAGGNTIEAGSNAVGGTRRAIRTAAWYWTKTDR